MDRHSSYSAPRSERSSGSHSGQRNRSGKRNTYNKRSWKDNKALFILVFVILPFIFINFCIAFFAVSTPKIDYTVSDTQDYKTVQLSIKIHSLLPLREMSVTLESQPIEMTKEKGVYKATLTQNGTLEILVTGWNGMTKRAYEHVATLDDAAPTIDQDNYTMENGLLTVTADDSQSGVNFDAAYGVDGNGKSIKPVSVDKETGKITFPMDTSTLTVYIEDYAGNTMKASFTNHTEGIDTDHRSTDFPSDGKNGTNGNSSTGKESSDKKQSTQSGSKTKESTQAAKATDKTKESTKAAKAKESAKATDKSKESTSKKATDKAKESTGTKATDKAKESTKANEASKANESSKASTESTKAPGGNLQSPTPAPTSPAAPANPAGPVPGEGSAPTQASQPAVPGGNSSDVTVVPLL